MKNAFFSALLLSLILSGVLPADVTALPPSEVTPEEVYTPAQMAEQYLQLMEQTLQQRCDAANEEDKLAATEKLNAILAHLQADPDLHAEIIRLLEKNPELKAHLKELFATLED